MIRVLHISDLHVGQADTDWLWPRMENILLRDLEDMFQRAGAWDIVVFSGDLTQKASSSEYDRLTKILKTLWEAFETWGFNPFFVVIPGNHDLVRPASMDPCTLALSSWGTNLELRNAVWNASTNAYTEFIESTFSNYINWYQSLSKEKIKIPIVKTGLMPGDFSTTIAVNEDKIGFVGLNSAWLQLSGADYERRLDVHPKQLLAVTENNPDAWAKNNNWNILVTHHPASWLTKDSLQLWNSDIYVGERFDFHMYGHMHEPNMKAMSEGGGALRRSVQAASLFGLERYNERFERIHGYSLIELDHANGQKRFRLWPRRAVESHGGALRIGSDQKFNLIQDSFIEDTFGQVAAARDHVVAPIAKTIALPTEVVSLHSIIRSTQHRKAYIEAWRLQINQSLSSIESRGWTWIVAGTDMGEEDFIKTLQVCMRVNRFQLLALDFNGCNSKEEMLRAVSQQVGGTFEVLLVAMGKSEPSLLLLEDVAVHGVQADSLVVQAIEGLQKIVQEFCPDIRVVVTSKVRPLGYEDLIQLGPLDEADARQYVLAHPQGGRDFDNSAAMAKLFLHSDGIPSRLDAAIDNARVFGLSALDSANADITGKLAVRDKQHPEWIIREVSALSSGGGGRLVVPIDYLRL